jgi:hypothetical protein
MLRLVENTCKGSASARSANFEAAPQAKRDESLDDRVVVR